MVPHVATDLCGTESVSTVSNLFDVMKNTPSSGFPSSSDVFIVGYPPMQDDLTPSKSQDKQLLNVERLLLLQTGFPSKKAISFEPETPHMLPQHVILTLHKRTY